MTRVASRSLRIRISILDGIAITVIAASAIFWFHGFRFAYYVRVPREFVVYSGAALLLACSAFRTNAWIGAFIGAAGINTLVHSLTNRIFFYESYYALMAVMAAAVIYVWATKTSEGTRRLCVQILLLSASASSVYALAQRMGWDPIGMYGNYLTPDGLLPVVGFLDNPGILGIFMALCAPLAVGMGHWAIPFILMGIFLSKSITGAIAAVISCLWLISRKGDRTRKSYVWWTVGIMTPVAVLLALGPARFKETRLEEGWAKPVAILERANIVKSTLWLWPHHVDWKKGKEGALKFSVMSLVGGWGLGSFHTRFPQYDFMKFGIGLHKQDAGGLAKNDRRIIVDDKGKRIRIIGEVWRQAHNEPIQAIFEGGLVFGLIILGFLWSHFKMKKVGKNAVYWASISAVLFTSLSHFPMHLTATAVPFMVMLGFLHGGKNA